MALVKCIECRQEISDKAISCPHCGRPYRIAEVNAPMGVDDGFKIAFGFYIFSFFLFVASSAIIGLVVWLVYILAKR
jgi:hypothetical protein